MPSYSTDAPCASCGATDCVLGLNLLCHDCEQDHRDEGLDIGPVPVFLADPLIDQREQAAHCAAISHGHQASAARANRRYLRDVRAHARRTTSA